MLQIFFNGFSIRDRRDSAHFLDTQSAGGISVAKSSFDHFFRDLICSIDTEHEQSGKETSPESIAGTGRIDGFDLFARNHPFRAMELVFRTICSQGLDQHANAVFFHKRFDIFFTAYKVKLFVGNL